MWADNRRLDLAITLSSALPLPDAALAQPRAVGAGKLCVLGDAQARTRIKDLRQSGATKLVFPTLHRSDAEVVLVNTAGGITGGDRFDLALDVGGDAALTLTTQAAERAYRAQSGEVAQVRSTARVAAGGSLNWLPQELILFDRAALNRRLEITLEGDARLLMVESMVFGRAAMGERLNALHFRDRIEITRDGRPIYLDALHLTGDAATHLARPAIGGGAGAMASVVLVAADAAAHLNAVRAALPSTAGASLIAPDVLVIRHLAPDSFELRRHLMPLLERLSPTPLPTSWRL